MFDPWDYPEPPVDPPDEPYYELDLIEEDGYDPDIYDVSEDYGESMEGVWQDD